MKLTRLAWVGGAIVLAVAAAALWPVAQAPAAGRTVPSTRVVRGTLKLDVHATGTLRASRVASLMAPPAGGTLRLVRMADTGAPLRAGDVAMEFDPAAQQFALEQANSELAEAEQEIIKMRADVDVRTAQDQVDLLTARFDVRRAELDALTDETLIAAVDRKKRLLALDEAKRRLAQLEEDIQSRSETNRAALAVVDEKRTKARLAAQRAQQIIDSLIVTSPIDGLVVARENRDVTNVFYSGMVLPEYRAGDLVMPGPARARSPRLRPHGGARQGERAGAREHRRETGSDRAGGRAAQRAARGARVVARRRRLARRHVRRWAWRDQDVRCRAPARQAGAAPQAWHVGARRAGRRGTEERPDAASAGDLPEERQADRLREHGVRVRGARGEDHPPDREPRRRRGRRRGRGSGPRESRDVSGDRLLWRQGPRLPEVPCDDQPCRRHPPGPRGRPRPRPRTAPGPRQPAHAQAAIDAHHARHDLRRGCRGGHAVHRRRRAAGGDRLHRAARRAQHHRRGARDLGPSGAAEDPEAVGGTVAAGSPRRGSECGRPRCRQRAQAADPVKAAAAAAGRDARGVRRRAGVCRAVGAARRVGPLLRQPGQRHGRRRGRAGPGRGRRAVRRREPHRAIREGERAVVPGDRRGRAATGRADRRRRAARAGPQQHHLRAAAGRAPAPGGRRRTT